MRLIVKPVKDLKGTIQLPASKSYSIRAFIVAACGGTSRIINPSNCDDAKVSIHAAKALGARVKPLRNNIFGVQVPRAKEKSSTINVCESGTVLRLLLPLLSLRKGQFVVKGEGTLKGRPNKHLVRALRKMGASIKGKSPQDSVPIKIIGGTLRGGNLTIDGTLSSQFISALLVASPQLKEDTKLSIKGKTIVSSDYVIMTEQVLRKSGVKIRRISPRVFSINGNQKFKGLKNFIVPSDYGLAAFMMGAAVLVRSQAILKGHLTKDFIQADGAILPLLRKMGVKFKKTNRSIKVSGPFSLKGGSFSLKNSPDLVPIMAILALFAKGKTRIYDIGHARVKESDRISDLRKELLKLGADVKETKNSLLISPQPKYKQNVLLDPHHDHRLAMAFSILGLKLGARVKDIECISKSYPAFISDLKSLGVVAKKGK